jgi:sugar lactone lactonase YvrE
LLPWLGAQTNQRVFADLTKSVGRPDGAAVDSDGCYWVCGDDGGYILRFTPQGKLDRKLDVPMLKPAMCAFVGKYLEQLLVTSIPSGKPEGAVWGGARAYAPFYRCAGNLRWFTDNVYLSRGTPPP